MSFQLTFDNVLNYNLNEEGIPLDVEISFGESKVNLQAKIDTGATYCIFERRFASELGLNLEDGMRQRFGTATGSFYCYGFRVNLTTADLHFDSVIFFAEDESFTRNVLGRIGWLDKIILGLIDMKEKFVFLIIRFNRSHHGAFVLPENLS